MLITFEGIDGCGKSTQIEKLKKYFDNKGIGYSVFREPGGTEISERIRSLLLHDTDEMDSVTEILLFSAARSQLIREKVIPLLEKNEIVILDRFYDSTTAYQGFGRNSSSLNDIYTLNKLASHGTVPDLTFYLKIDPKTADQRTKGNKKDRLESAGDDFFKKVATGYDMLASTDKRFRVIDAGRLPDEIHREIVDIIGAYQQ
ncbi:MAG: dTMP kinase [Balneolaceae bacterium]|nr:MAG: dTMP kinase [Balneolaceae bacterium]